MNNYNAFYCCLLYNIIGLFNYRRFVSDSGKGGDVAKIQSQNKILEQQLNAYRQRLKDLSDVVSKNDLDRILLRYGLRDILEMPQPENGIGNHMANINGSNTPDLGQLTIFLHV